MLNMQTTTIDRQAAFDLMVAKLYEQGKRATTPDQNSCEYLSEDGSRCAIGWLIDDDLISRELSGVVDTALRMLGIKLLEDDVHFLRHAQTALHDGIPEDLSREAFHRSLMQRAKIFAENFGLKFDRNKFSG